MTIRDLVLAGAGLVGASTAATSAVSLYQLAVLCGIPGPLAAALPIALDAGAGVAALVWITEQGELRSWGRGVAIAALLATLAGNGVQHAITSGLLAVTLPLVLLVGACIPAMLWAVVHLAALTARPAPATGESDTGESDTGASAPAPRAPKPRSGRVTPTPSRPAPTPATEPDALGAHPDHVELAVKWAVDELAAGRTAGWKRITNGHPLLSEYHARSAATEAKRRHDQRPTLKVAAS